MSRVSDNRTMARSGQDICERALELIPVPSKLPKDLQTFTEALKTTPLKNSENT